MTLVDFIDLDHDEWYVKVDVIDLSSDEDSVKKDANVEDREEEDDNVPLSENLAEAATSLPISEQDTTATTSLSMVDHGSTMSSLMEDKFMQPEKQEFLATSDGTKEATPTQPGNHEFIAAADCVGEAMQSVCEAGVFSSMTEQDAATSLSLTKQGAITSSLKEEKYMQSVNQVFVAAVDCAKEAIQSENTAKTAGSPSMTERGATCKSHRVGQLCKTIGCPHILKDGLDLYISHGGGHPHGEPGSSTVPRTKSDGVRGDAGNAIGSIGICNLHAQEESERNKEKETSRFRKFYSRKGNKQVNTSDTGYNRQLGIVHTKGETPTLHDGDSGFSVMGNIRNGTASIGINVLDGEVLVSTYQGCSKTSQGNTTYCDNGSKCCMVEGCTNGAHGSTPLCIFHNSRPHRRRCAVIGCTKEARTSCQGLAQRCVKHGGGKRCKYDGCGKGAKGATDYCIAHGGGTRCKFQGCRKVTRVQTDYCIEHGGGRRCRLLGCSVSATYGKDFCSMYRISLLSDNNSAHEILPAPAPARRAKKAEPSKGRNSCSVIGGIAQKRRNTNDHVNTGSFNIIETAEEKGRVFVCQNNMLKAQVRDYGSECCMVEGCTNGAHESTPPCIFHNSRPHRMCCAVIGCTKEARSSCQGLTQRCVKHGGGKRCKYDGCGKGAKGSTDYCIAHGGGRRCKFQGCRKSAQGQTDYCSEHGGGRRCRFQG